jgi:hypothetical protein
MRQTILIAAGICLTIQSCAQNRPPDTPEAFAERLLNALASPTRNMLDDEIIISKKEHREWCEMKVRIEFFDNVIQDEVFLERQSGGRHEFEWEENQEGFRFQFRENWNPKFKEWTLWEDAVLLEAKIDTSAALFGKDFAKNTMKNIEPGYFTAKYQLPEEDFYRNISTVVCRINDGRWKVVRYIGLGERD